MKNDHKIINLLDELQALYEVKKEGHKQGTLLKELAQFLKKPTVRTWEWIIGRKYTPDLGTFLVLQERCAFYKSRLTKEQLWEFQRHLEIIQHRRNIKNRK